MGRTLPWLVNAASTKAPVSTKRAVPGQANGFKKRQKVEDGTAKPRTSKGSDDEGPARSHSKAGKRDGDIFSSSPPVIEEPVPEEFMREGVDADDIFIMVEDEFYDVARTFTAHIHQQEYERLRQEARERNAGRTTSVARPVDGKSVLPKDKKMAKDRKDAAAKRKQKLADVTGSSHESSDTDMGNEEEQDARWAGTTLGGLMLSPSKAQKSLVGLQGPTIKSRAAAGFKEAQITPSKQRVLMRPFIGDDASATSEDDLDASPPAASGRKRDPRNASPTPQTRRQRPWLADYPIKSRPADPNRVANYAVKVEDARTANPIPVSADVDDMDDLDSYFRLTPLVNTRRTVGQQTRVKTEETAEQRKRNYDEIPIFLG